MNRVFSVAVLAAMLATALPATASANKMRERGSLLDRGSHQREPMISVFGLAPYHHNGVALGAGLRFTLPIVPDGFIPPINDSFELEFGGDFAMDPSWGVGDDWRLWSAPAVAEARWSFHITPKFSAYAKIGVGLELDYYSWDYNNHGYYYEDDDLDLSLHHTEAVGVLFKLGDSFFLRGEAGYPDVRIGLGFAL